MEFIDAHLHFGGREDEILGCQDIYVKLQALGLRKVYLLCFTTYGLDFSDIIRVAPYHARSHYHPDFVDSNLLLQKVREELEREDFIVPFLDFRIIHGDIESWLEHYMPFGYQGLKTLFIPEYDDFLQVESPADILKTTKSSYLDWQQRVMDYGQGNSLPLICHLNLHNHFEYATEFLSNFPNLQINFPHLGFSRKKMSQLLDKFSNCYSDISGLYDHIEKDPKRYCDYIEHYKERVMFGSDCAWNEAKRTEGYLRMVEGLPLNPGCRRKLLYDVALKFLGNENPSREDV
jgi:hypothetical protein